MAKSEDLRLQGDSGPKRGGNQSKERNQKRVHYGDNYDLTNDRKLCVFTGDGVFGRHRFVLAQTDGDTAFTPSIPGFDLATTLRELHIEQVDFTSTDGNAQGYAFERSIAINPLAQLPHKTTFHELGHIVLGHTEEGRLVDSELTPRNIREVEAESVALICCEALQLAGTEYARGYIQAWLSGDGISDRSTQRIFSAASAILKAGRGESASRESG